MRKTLIDGKSYLGTKIVPMYKIKSGTTVCCQQVATEDGCPVKKYIDFGDVCLAVVDEGSVVVYAEHNGGNINIRISKIEDIENPAIAGATIYYDGRVLFEGSLEEYERKRTLKEYEDVVEFTVNNLYTLIGGHYVIY